MTQARFEGLYGIAGPAGPGPFEQRLRETLAMVDALLAADVALIQLRDKEATGRELYDLACAVRRLVDGRAHLVINDRLDVALAARADGVHLGQEDLDVPSARDVLVRLGRPQGFLVGLSTHTADEVRAGVALGVDYVGFGPVFPTSTKPDAHPVRGLERLAEAVNAAGTLPVVAIGGIGLDNVAEVVRAGASMAAVISDVQRATDPAARACAVQRAMRDAKG
jgi:thiamine-phosphate pyrophosphorylase